MNKSELLSKMQTEYDRWNRLLTDMSEELIVQPGAVGEWSVKDVIAHIAAWERRSAVQLMADLHGETPTGVAVYGRECDLATVDKMSEDEFNNWMAEDSRDKSLEEVLAASQRAHQLLVAAVEAMSEEDLSDPQRQFKGFEWKHERPMWQAIAAVSYEHSAEHETPVLEWLEGIETS